MSASALPKRRVSFGALIAQGDHWRRSPGSASGPAGHKEWSHFCVLGGEVDLLVNLSLSDLEHGEGRRIEVPHTVALARGPDGLWEGDVDGYAHEDTWVRGGSMDLRMGPNALRFRDGAYDLALRLAHRPVAARLCLTPLTPPALTSSIALGPAGAMKWFVVPRLAASGEIRLGDRLFRLRDAPAYHDHDWGRFAWGGDFSWEWAIALEPRSRSPWTLVFQRISDRPRLRAFSQGLLVWKGASHLRTMHGEEVSVESAGLLRARRALRIPRIMRLAAPGTAGDLPRRLEVRATRGGDVVEVSFELIDLAQIAVPNDGEGRGATLISEVRAHACVAGRVRGEAVCFRGTALVELNRASA